MAHTPQLCPGCLPLSSVQGATLLDAVCLMQVCTEHTSCCGVPPPYQCVSNVFEIYPCFMCLKYILALCVLQKLCMQGSFHMGSCIDWI